MLTHYSFYRDDLLKLQATIEAVSKRQLFGASVVDNAKLHATTPDNKVAIKLISDSPDVKWITDVEKSSGITCRKVDPPIPGW